jgi:predicted ATP-grasp superfamily ATP-dependent carboligase
MNSRLHSLAARALAALDMPIVGYIGVDLVLGDSPGGEDDVVIEINPRLTTSYVGLSLAAMKMECNLGAAMLAVAQGKPPDLMFSREPIEFYADGTFAG